MVVSLASATPVFTSTTNSCSSAHVSLPPRFVCGVPSRRRGGLFKNPLRVAAPPSTPVTDISEEDQEKFDPLIETEGSEEIPSSKFSWRDHWYPVSLVEDLNPRYPTPFQLLNRDIVLWFDSSASEWVAFDDKCPHRLAPLSEGRIDENGILQCSYHGWSFDGCGSCTRQAAIEDPRLCCFRGRVNFQQGFSSLSLFGQMRMAGKRAAMPPQCCPMILISLSFHLLQFSAICTMAMILSWRMCPILPTLTSHTTRIEIDAKLPVVGDQKWVIWICSFNVPMAPGKTRSIVCSARNFFQFSMPGPAWWQEGSGDINQQYTKITFTPTQADRFVLAFRNWLRRHGNSQPEWFGNIDQQPLPSTVLSKRQTLQKFLIGAAVVCAATAGIPPDMQIRIVLGAVAVLGAASAYALNELQKNFVFVDYIHADID
ncbi:UNVERIFIED_CONTAM: Pheophorbide a oxygenase, chloroplastic [Sesamum latifolium]|uniref:Pheophorbide a oxygenase, chloroplastic n=1 Tax=Sesamum latifolium TaxID=2727402 RepID=A0AAW2Y337_9LAMI